MKPLGPVVGMWYKDLQANACFEVVAWDADARTIETQHIDGEVSEYDLDTWRQLLLITIEEPEDWRNAFELDANEFSDPDLPFHPEDWSGPLANIEPEFMNGVEEY
jgi:hypothetical protein